MLLNIDEHVHVVALIGKINRFINSSSTKQLTHGLTKRVDKIKSNHCLGCNSVYLKMF